MCVCLWGFALPVGSIYCPPGHIAMPFPFLVVTRLDCSSVWTASVYTTGILPVEQTNPTVPTAGDLPAREQRVELWLIQSQTEQGIHRVTLPPRGKCFSAQLEPWCSEEAVDLRSWNLNVSMIIKHRSFITKEAVCLPEDDRLNSVVIWHCSENLKVLCNSNLDLSYLPISSSLQLPPRKSMMLDATSGSSSSAAWMATVIVTVPISCVCWSTVITSSKPRSADASEAHAAGIGPRMSTDPLMVPEWAAVLPPAPCSPPSAVAAAAAAAAAPAWTLLVGLESKARAGCAVRKAGRRFFFGHQ